MNKPYLQLLTPFLAYVGVALPILMVEHQIIKSFHKIRLYLIPHLFGQYSTINNAAKMGLRRRLLFL